MGSWWQRPWAWVAWPAVGRRGQHAPCTCWETRARGDAGLGRRPGHGCFAQQMHKEPLCGADVPPGARNQHLGTGWGWPGCPGGLQPLPVPQLRSGATATIGPQTLRAEDEDSPAAEVTFSIQPPVNGKVVLRPAPDVEVRRFTQAQIDSGLVLFVHQGTARTRRPLAPTRPQALWHRAPPRAR